MPVEEFAAVLADLKPKFIHHPESKDLIERCSHRSAATSTGPTSTSRACGRRRPTTTSSSGISYAFHPHRDTWYSAPFCQLNWWIPIFPVVPENVMAFHPQYWGTSGPERIAALQLLRVEPDQPADCRTAHQD